MTLSLIALFFFAKCSARNKMHSNHNRFTHSRFRLFAATPGEIKVKKSWRGRVADRFWIHSSIPIAEMKDNNRRLSRALNTCKEAKRSMYLCYSAAIVLHGYAVISFILLIYYCYYCYYCCSMFVYDTFFFFDVFDFSSLFGFDVLSVATSDYAIISNLFFASPLYNNQIERNLFQNRTSKVFFWGEGAPLLGA